jgi:hypothetical protein
MSDALDRCFAEAYSTLEARHPVALVKFQLGLGGTTMAKRLLAALTAPRRAALMMSSLGPDADLPAFVAARWPLQRVDVPHDELANLWCRTDPPPWIDAVRDPDTVVIWDELLGNAVDSVSCWLAHQPVLMVVTGHLRQDDAPHARVIPLPPRPGFAW